MYIENDDKICMNCQHRDFAHEVELPVKRPWGWSMEVCAPCLIEASECDAGPGVHMYAETEIAVIMPMPLSHPTFTLRKSMPAPRTNRRTT